MRYYGEMPKECGYFDVECEEYMFTQYVPISIPGQYRTTVPENLKWTEDILSRICGMDLEMWKDSYVYVTCKHMYVDGFSGNRPGVHSDGFMTDDLSYIWYDSYPTIFYDGVFDLTQDHAISLVEMEKQSRNMQVFHFPVKNLVKLDQYNIHSVRYCSPGFRTFLKISISKHKYNLKGNSKNPELSLDCEYSERTEQRNDPHKDKL